MSPQAHAVVTRARRTSPWPTWSSSASPRCASGLGEADARLTADVLVTTDTFGVFTHGTKSLAGYVRRLRGGGLKADAVPRIEAEGPGWAIVDGQSAIGMVTSVMAMNTAIRKAAQTGTAYVGVHNSCHFGAAGYYANMAAKADMIGIAMANDCPSMTVPARAGVGHQPLRLRGAGRRGRSDLHGRRVQRRGRRQGLGGPDPGQENSRYLGGRRRGLAHDRPVRLSRPRLAAPVRRAQGLRIRGDDRGLFGPAHRGGQPRRSGQLDDLRSALRHPPRRGLPGSQRRRRGSHRAVQTARWTP